MHILYHLVLYFYKMDLLGDKNFFCNCPVVLNVLITEIIPVDSNISAFCKIFPSKNPGMIPLENEHSSIDLYTLPVLDFG